MTPRVLTLDIETAPLECYTWGIFDQNIRLEMIKTDWSILSFSAKWLDEKAVHFESTGGRGANKVRDDKKLVQSLWEYLDQADLVVAQNGKRFDIKKINARLLAHDLGPYSPIRVVDTLIEAKRNFGFVSNKLAWLSKKLAKTKKSEHKQFPGFELWLECLADNPKAWAEMAKYNKIDVISTEEVYLVLRPFISTHPNVGAYIQDKDILCPKCGSKDLQRRGYSMSQQGSYPRYQCKGCGGWARGKNQQLSTDVRKAQLVGV